MKAATPPAVRLPVAIAGRLVFAAIAILATVVFSYLLMHPTHTADRDRAPHSTLSPSTEHQPQPQRVTAILR